MTRFTDGNKTVEIQMMTWDGQNYSDDMSGEFFEVGGLTYDDAAEAYVVNDVDYLIDYANDYQAGKGDFYNDRIEVEERGEEWTPAKVIVTEV